MLTFSNPHVELNPELTAKSLLNNLLKVNPGQFTFDQLRTLQRRVAEWRKQQLKINHEESQKNLVSQHDSILMMAEDT
jgi:hypothetical protein